MTYSIRRKGAQDSFLKFIAATCVLDDIRPSQASVLRWILSVEAEIGTRSRKEGDHLPSWWDQRALLFFVNNIEPIKSWDVNEYDVFD